MFLWRQDIASISSQGSSMSVRFRLTAPFKIKALRNVSLDGSTAEFSTIILYVFL